MKPTIRLPIGVGKPNGQMVPIELDECHLDCCLIDTCPRGDPGRNTDTHHVRPISRAPFKHDHTIPLSAPWRSTMDQTEQQTVPFHMLSKIH